MNTLDSSGQKIYLSNLSKRLTIKTSKNNNLGKECSNKRKLECRRTYIFQGEWKNVTAVQIIQTIRCTFAAIHWLIQVRVLGWPKLSG